MYLSMPNIFSDEEFKSTVIIYIKEHITLYIKWKVN